MGSREDMGDTCACKRDAAQVRPTELGFLLFRGEGNFHLCPQCLAWCNPEHGKVSAPQDVGWLESAEPIDLATRISLALYVRHYQALAVEHADAGEEPD